MAPPASKLAPSSSTSDGKDDFTWDHYVLTLRRFLIRLTKFLNSHPKLCTTGKMKRRIFALADDFIAGTHEALNVRASSQGKPTISLHAYASGLRSKAYGSTQHNSYDEDSILALAEPTGDFHAGVRVQKTFFHTSWDLNIINCVDLRAFLLVLERNVIQPSPGAAGIGLLAPMNSANSTTNYVDSQPNDPLMVCSSDSTTSQLLAVEAELQPSEAKKLRATIDKGVDDAAEKHGHYHQEEPAVRWPNVPEDPRGGATLCCGSVQGCGGQAR